MKQTNYKIQKPQVISEVFDDEVVAVNFDTGSYYGMAGPAREVWNCLEQGFATQSILEWLASRYAASPTRIREDLEAFLSRLEAEKLVAPAEESGSSGIASIGQPGERLPWEAPTISVYEDMQDLLLLDPIHDVDETGWPVRKAPVEQGSPGTE